MTAAIILISIWYINTYVLKGDDMQLILVKSVCFIICSMVVSVMILKVISPKEVNADNLKFLFGLIRDMALLIVGTLFNKKSG